MTVMLRGEHSFVTADGKHVPRRLLELTHARANKLVVADEVTIGPPGRRAASTSCSTSTASRLVVVETKNPIKQGATWLTAAKDIHDVYEAEFPNFFAPNVFNVATDGNELRVGAVGSNLMTSPGRRGFDRTEPDADRSETHRGGRQAAARPGVGAVDARDVHSVSPPRLRGGRDDKDGGPLPAGRGRRCDRRQGAPRRQGRTHLAPPGQRQDDGDGVRRLSSPSKTPTGRPDGHRVARSHPTRAQASEAFRTAGMPSMHIPENSYELRKLLRGRQSGSSSPPSTSSPTPAHSSDRRNIIVLVDEAHRTQEGSLAAAMRAAVPNATFFGMTGTPISDKERNTFTLFR